MPPTTAMSRTRQDPRWQAILQRDTNSDGLFVYGVRTTGVYCRPSCPSRQALPENVSFHETPAAAEQAGFRACKRCRPDQEIVESGPAQAVAALCRHIEQAQECPSLEQLAALAGWSPWHTQRTFKAHSGLTPRQYFDATRSQRLREALPAAGSVTDAIYQAGYGSGSRFYERADQELGMTPSQRRQGGAGSRIRFAVGQTSLGSILVAQSERGICTIELGDDPEQLLRDLQDRFPAAELLGGDTAFEQTVAQVVGLVEQPSIGLDLPLDIQGTAFQRRVWRALLEIPAGETISYARLAEAIGQPGAARAVASACAANQLAIAIPCHRVVRQDGGLSGYRWGVERKRRLLKREAAGG